MKIEKLGILDIQWLDSEIESLEPFVNKDDVLTSVYHALKTVKSKLLPAKKLAEIDFGAGAVYIIRYSK